MSRLTPAERKQIISDYKHGIANPNYRVIDRGDGTFQVRKRDSKFKSFIKKSLSQRRRLRKNQRDLRMRNYS